MRPETGQALLAEVSQLARGTDSPPLLSLVDRPVKQRPAAGDARETLELVRDITPLQRVPSSSVPAHRLMDALCSRGRTAAPSGAQSCVAVLGAHGGAGVSSLLRAGLTAAGGIDAGGTWPVAEPVLLVARTSTSGLEQVQNLVRQHAEGLAGGACELLGLVLVADAPGRLPRRVSELADLVSGGFTRVWQIPWLEEWRLAAASEPLPVHPDVARLHAELQSLVGVERRRAC